MAGPAPAVVSADEQAAVAVDTRQCPECGHLLGGRYCANCGQEAELAVPTFRKFIHEFAGDELSVDGKLPRTLWMLVRRPGQLTQEYMAGRRQRYVRPLRLYLTLSLLFFLVFGLGSNFNFNDGGQSAKPTKTGISISSPSAPRQALKPPAPQAASTMGVAAPAGAANAESGKDRRVDANMDFSLEGDDYSLLGKRIGQFKQLPPDRQKEVLSDRLRNGLPYAVFILMPLLAAGFHLLYLGRGRRYGEHFLFVLHAQSFAFLAMLIGQIDTLSALDALSDTLDVLVFFSLVIYLYLAMRRYYASSRWSTLWRMSVLLGAYGLFLSLAIAVSVLVAVVI